MSRTRTLLKTVEPPAAPEGASPAAMPPAANVMAAAAAAGAQEVWPVDRIRANVRNARKHPKKQIEQLRKSVRTYGQVWPLLVRQDGTLISGHGRLEALKHEGHAEVKVIVVPWDDVKCRAFGLLDNRVTLNSEWDEDLLGMEAKDLQLAGIDLTDLGFDPREIEKLAPPPPVSNENDAKPEGRTLKAVIQYNIVFDDETQQQAWFAFIKRLKAQYPDAETFGARIANFIGELPAHVPAPKVEGNATG